jgi:hypothetical protein
LVGGLSWSDRDETDAEGEGEQPDGKRCRQSAFRDPQSAIRISFHPPHGVSYRPQKLRPEQNFNNFTYFS